MTGNIAALVDGLIHGRSLSLDEYEALVGARAPQLQAELAGRAREACEAVYGDAVFARGLIEISNICQNDCYYCGIRRSNRHCRRYRLSADEIMACAEEGWRAGFRTLVLQSGEAPVAADGWLAGLIGEMKASFPGCAITLSLGERSQERYALWRQAGADRYLLRHETATDAHYRRLHPDAMSLSNRLLCLEGLRKLGYAVGTGFMVGSPCQKPRHVAADLKLIEQMAPEMCGIGPFVPHRETPFANRRVGSVDMTCYLLSIIRLMRPTVLLPATTALEALDSEGRERAILSGANVVMPNLTPREYQESYELYDRKPVSNEAAFRQWAALEARLASLGRRLVIDRGDPAEPKEQEAIHG